MKPSRTTFGCAVGDVVAVFIGDEEQLGRAHEPDAAAADLDAGEHLHLVGEDGALVGFAVVVGVLEDEDAVAEAQSEADFARPVGVVFGDPHAARLSQAMAMGFCTSGSEAKTVMSKPSGSLNDAAASAAGIGPSLPAGSVLKGAGKSPSAKRGKGRMNEETRRTEGRIEMGGVIRIESCRIGTASARGTGWKRSPPALLSQWIRNEV